MNHGPTDSPACRPDPPDRRPGRPTPTWLVVWFASYGDEAGFELLVRRHRPMVLGVCHRILADPNHPDGAFQAAFLVLARKAMLIGRTEAVTVWLHWFAFRSGAPAGRGPVAPPP